MEENNLITWLDNNQLNNKKVRSRKIVLLLDKFLALRDEEKVNLIVSYYDKDYFKENNMGPKIENIAQYYVLNYPWKLHGNNIKQGFQNQIRELLDIATKPQSNVFYDMETKYEALFAECAMQLARNNETKKQSFVQFFMETFPETPRYSNKVHSKSKDFEPVQTPAINIIESALQNLFDYESLTELKKSGFDFYEPNGFLIKQAMFSTVNYYPMSYPGKKILDLLFNEGNEVNTLSLVSAVQNSKAHDILKTLVSHYPNDQNINEPIWVDNQNNKKTDLFNSLVENQNFNSLNDIQIFLDQGMSIPFDKKTIVESMVKNQKNTHFIDEVLSISQKTPHEKPYLTNSIVEFDQFITNMIQSKYPDPSIVQVLEQHDMLSNPVFKNPESAYVQSKINNWKKEVQKAQDVNFTGQAIVQQLENKLNANKKPTILGYIKDFKNKKKTSKNLSLRGQK